MNHWKIVLNSQFIHNSFSNILLKHTIAYVYCFLFSYIITLPSTPKCCKPLHWSHPTYLHVFSPSSYLVSLEVMLILEGDFTCYPVIQSPTPQTLLKFLLCAIDHRPTMYHSFRCVSVIFIHVCFAEMSKTKKNPSLCRAHSVNVKRHHIKSE